MKRNISVISNAVAVIRAGTTKDCDMISLSLNDKYARYQVSRYQKFPFSVGDRGV
jgi:hypothetical protein